VPVGLCLLIEKGLSVVSEFFFQIFWYLLYIYVRGGARAESEQIQYPGNRLNDSRAIPQLVRQGKRYIVIYCC